MLAAIVAALALAGAPAGTPVTCNPTLTNGDSPELGVTHFAAVPVAIELRGTLCAGLVYASASRRDRAAIRRLNPHMPLLVLEGAGLLVMLHEAEHVALASRDECLVERAAMAKLPALVNALLPRAERAAAISIAQADDAALPSSYHGC